MLGRENEHKAAVKIQSAFRRHLAQKKYGFTQLTSAELQNYSVFATGNDPEFTELRRYQLVSREQIALVATSGLRAISIACELSNPVTTPAPKIIIVDNSIDVRDFWRGIREAARNSHDSVTLSGKAPKICNAQSKTLPTSIQFKVK